MACLALLAVSVAVPAVADGPIGVPNLPAPPSVPVPPPPAVPAVTVPDAQGVTNAVAQTVTPQRDQTPPPPATPAPTPDAQQPAAAPGAAPAKTPVVRTSRRQPTRRRVARHVASSARTAPRRTHAGAATPRPAAHHTVAPRAHAARPHDTAAPVRHRAVPAFVDHAARLTPIAHHDAIPPRQAPPAPAAAHRVSPHLPLPDPGSPPGVMLALALVLGTAALCLRFFAVDVLPGVRAGLADRRRRS